MKEENIIEEIKKAISLNSETQMVEFKDARGGFPKAPIKRSLSAFGNTRNGGIIVFGVEEDVNRKLSVVGVNDISSLQENMSNITTGDMSAVVRLDYFVIEIEGKKVLAFFVPECRNHEKPYYIKDLGWPRGAYVREGNTNRQMTEGEVRDYIRNAQGDDFDGTCIDILNESDLSETKIKEFLSKSAKRAQRETESSGGYQEVLQNIGITKACNNTIHPTFAGYIIFSKQQPQQVLRFERYIIRCVRYKGSGVHSDIIDSIDIAGTLDEQIDGMQAFILRNIKRSAEIVGTKRVNKYEYPEKAIREIIANAVIHRDYRITETYTQVNIFEDRIEVSNPGNLPLGVTVDNIRDSQVSRNKIIAARLKDLDYLEEYGRGINIVFTEMGNWGLLPPLFKNSSNSFKVILPGERLSKLNNRQLQIWEYLTENNRITRKEAETLLEGVPQQTSSLDLRNMRDMGLIEQQGESKKTFYQAKF
ncbi:MAG: ATP-binding protein [bacterium]